MKIRENNIYDYSSAPVNGNASRVIQRGKGYEFDVKSSVPEWDNPPLVRPRHQLPRDRDFTDLTGIRKGRFIVKGLLPGPGSKWLVRCSCGKYTYRTAKAIRSLATNPNAHHDACRQCTALAFAKREAEFRRTGKDTDIQDYF
ncbi:hypothetical protein ACJVQT_23025 [Enterobacter huaxiensis]|uniref:hypothetical protein n=1 Tax=Enterobacter huaxiensis TaxID=2494702 RepID=UPI002175FBD3|nr:hypothetical protein [Enterobacter huaxiensis]MCS5452540.1 hypothetical protein [Enterobacter huaxiensis]